ncbi:hypothetical protein AJ87_17325 [Rhizobium yanglingense]|nr:hypothetical protein AJ87_17325 [Rhizobium yanglingense]
MRSGSIACRPARSKPLPGRYSSPEKLEQTRKGIPLQRLGTAEDCAPAYLFLAAPSLSGYITGQVLEINGGQLIC